MVGLEIFVHLVRWLLFDNCPKWVVVLVPLDLTSAHSTQYRGRYGWGESVPLVWPHVYQLGGLNDSGQVA